MRVAVDTNVLVSAAIKPHGQAGRLLTHLRNDKFTLLYSMEALEELVDVLSRAHLREKYKLTPHYVSIFLHVIRLRGERIEPTHQIKVCRDPQDDMFLEVAVSGSADYLISKDDDLLVLSPFGGVPIVPPAVFLQQLES